MTEPSQSSSTAPDPDRPGQFESEPAAPPQGTAGTAADQPPASTTPTPDAVWAGQPPIGPDGREVPVAVLPGTPGPQQSPEPQHMPGPQETWNAPPAPPVQGPPRSKGRAGLIVAAVVMFVAAATFGTLWFVERGNHSDTTAQAEVVRQDRDRVKEDADRARTELRQTKDKLTEASTERRKLEESARDNKSCADEGRNLAKVVEDEGSDQAFREALVKLVIFCL